MNGRIPIKCIALALLGATALLQGCNEVVLFNPKGPIGESERQVIIIAFVLMLIVVIPVIIMSVWFPIKYRASNTKAAYEPDWCKSNRIEAVMWLIPVAIIVALSVVAWRETHRLDPYKPIAAVAAPIEVEVISLDWKWLFIYPKQQIAVVNELVFPAKAPLSFRLTSDTVMTSFFIPQLGSQIYAMAGMETKLHLLADEPGRFFGQNQQFSGAGFPQMSFPAVADSPENFEAWVAKVKGSPDRLDKARLEELCKPGVSESVLYFSSIEPGLFESVIGKYAAMPMHAKPSGDTMQHPAHGQ